MFKAWACIWWPRQVSERSPFAGSEQVGRRYWGMATGFTSKVCSWSKRPARLAQLWDGGEKDVIKSTPSVLQLLTGTEEQITAKAKPCKTHFTLNLRLQRLSGSATR